MIDMPKFDMINVGDALPVQEYSPDNIQLFLYNAALWNAHLIHFDHPYATEVEGYPGLVVPGPLMGDWLTQIAIEWAGDDGDLVNINYSNRQYAISGETLHSAGNVISVSKETRQVELEINILNAKDEVLTPGRLTVQFK